jgi:hypothetical protein
MYAGGGISYFSSGSAKRPLGGAACNAVALRAGVCAEAIATKTNEPRQINSVVAETLEDLISNYVDSLLSVETREAIQDSRSKNPEGAALERFP